MGVEKIRFESRYKRIMLQTNLASTAKGMPSVKMKTKLSTSIVEPTFLNSVFLWIIKHHFDS